jgi:hypothetical protein
MDPDNVRRAAKRKSIEELANEITRLAGHLNAANYRFLKLIAEFDRCKGWGGDGATASCAHWLNWKCGIDIGAAREKVRVANALEKLPLIAAAMENGTLSYSKARALTRVACEGTQEYFLSIALHGTAHHVETLVRHYRRCQEAEELSREARQQANRCFSYRYDDDGSLVFKGRVPAEIGALLLKALDAAIKENGETDRGNLTVGVSAETPERPQPEPIRARRADALGRVAETFLDHGGAALSGGDRNLVTVHVAAETLRTKEAGCCEIEEGPSIAAETARRLACDASIVAVIENEDGEPLNVGRKTRTISSPLRRFLKARDKGCRFPGCTNTHWVDAHHIKHWANGGETKPSNLVCLCRFHHHKVHEGAVQVHVLDDGAIRFTQPNGTSFESVAPGCTQPLSDWTQIPAEHDECGIHIDERTAATKWAGESMDYGLGVQVLLQQAKKHRDAAARAI